MSRAIEGLIAYGSDDDSDSSSLSPTNGSDAPGAQPPKENHDSAAARMARHADTERRKRNGENASTDREGTVPQDVTPAEGTETAFVVRSPQTAAREAALDARLPPPPEEDCKDDVRIRVQHIVDSTRSGRNFLEDLRGKKEFNNPYILEHVADHFGLSQEDQWASHSIHPHLRAESVDYRSLRRAQEEREAERAEWKQRRAEISFAPSSTLAATMTSGSQALYMAGRDTTSSDAGGADGFAASVARAQAKAREILSASSSAAGGGGYSRPR